MEWLKLANRTVRRGLTVAGVESRWATVGGERVHFYRARRRRRQGPPMLLVHGLGSNANAFFRTLQPLARRFGEVYALDLPGNGFSPLPARGPLRLQEHLEVLRAFRREVVGEPVFLVGNSLGGGMALSTAVEEPAAVRALALVAPAGAQVSEARFAELLDSFRVHDAAKARALAHKLFHRAPLPLLFFADELRKMVSTETVRRIVAEVSTADLAKPEQLRALSMPTLLLWGQSEKLLPYEGLDFFRAHLPPHAEVHEVRGFGHMPQMERPRALVERLTKFAQAHGLVQAP
jgi:pimeloyl-ACP methyl ester carboxylesterase